MTRPSYFIRVALNNTSRNLGMNLVAVATIALAMAIMGFFLLIQLNLEELVESSSRGLSVSVYLDDGLSSKAADGFRRKVESIEGVKKVRLISKDEALTDLRKRLGEKSGVLDGLDQNPLPTSLEIELAPGLREEGKLEPLIKKIEGLEGAAEVHYAWEWAEKLRDVARLVRVGGLVIGALLFAAVVFIIANTIKLTVMARWEELYVMRLMGATESFIRTPFIIEGLLQGLAGAAASQALLFAGFKIVSGRVRLPLGLSLVEPVYLSSNLVWFIIAAGAGLGFIGSYLSVGRLMRN